MAHDINSVSQIKEGGLCIKMTEEKIDVEGTHTNSYKRYLLPAEWKRTVFAKLLRIFHKNALKCNGCASKKFLQVFIYCFDIKQSIAQINKTYASMD